MVVKRIECTQQLTLTLNLFTHRNKLTLKKPQDYLKGVKALVSEMSTGFWQTPQRAVTPDL